MNSFYEITAIDLNNKLNVEVELVEHDHPKYLFTVNNLPVAKHQVLSFGLLSYLGFKCQVDSGAVEIRRITVNGKEIMPIYLHLADPKTNWITGNWAFVIAEPFYPWYHQITGQGWIA